MNTARHSMTLGLALLLAACSSNSGGGQPQQGGSSGSGGTNASGGNNSGSGGDNGSGGNAGGSGGNSSGAGGSSNGGGSGGNSGNGGSAAGAGGSGNGGAAGSSGGTNGGGASGSSSGGSNAGGSSGTGGSTSPGTGGTSTPSTVLVTSASGAYWKTDGKWTEVTSGNANVTVNDSSTAQTWEGFGGAFNEIGWNVLTTSDMQTQAMQLLFSATDGANFAWGRIPMGASDYAMSRYTLDDTGDDVTANSAQSNRPPQDTSLSKFSLDRDNQKLIPYIKAAQGVKSDIRFWSSPWTPPVWMKTGYKSTQAGSLPNWKPSYFDGGNFISSNNDAILSAYAQYYTKFVQGYKDKGIKIEYVAPQNEPGYDQNYPSCLWDKTTYVNWVKALGQAMSAINVKVMLGTLSNNGDNSRTDMDIANAVLADSTAKNIVSVVGAQWGILGKVVSDKGSTFGSLHVWATEHKCGNYPWNPSGFPAYNNTQAPNDQAYGVESWGNIRDAIVSGKVTAYNAWNMVLDKSGLGIDTSRDWKQDALLVADSGKVNTTPAYWVFRHLSQYVVPGATVVATSGGDAIAFKNPDGSLVAVMFNSGSANSNYVVSIGGKKLQFAMPGNGWATVKYKP